MARLPRLDLPDIPYHVTQRGNRRQAVFLRRQDRAMYLRLLREQAVGRGLDVWAYCLMDNHVHLIVVPRQDHALTRAIAETHRQYTRFVNLREGWRGYLWQGRFGSVALDERHLIAAVRYVERNPVAAGMVRRAEDYPWSSAAAHVHGTRDPLLTHSFLDTQISNWAAFLRDPKDDPIGTQLQRHSSVGRPLGSLGFLQKLEQMTGRRFQAGAAGRPEEVFMVSPD